MDPVSGKVDLSLRLSRVDPEAAKKARKVAAAEKEQANSAAVRPAGRTRKAASDGESVDTRYVRKRNGSPANFMILF